MTLKSRIDRLSRTREQILIVNSLPDTAPDVGILPLTPKLEGESNEAWYERLHALGRELFPRARIIAYPQIRDMTP